MVTQKMRGNCAMTTTRIKVLSSTGKALKPTKLNRANRWLYEGKAIQKFTKSGEFCVQIPNDQKLRMAIMAIINHDNFSDLLERYCALNEPNKFHLSTLKEYKFSDLPVSEKLCQKLDIPVWSNKLKWYYFSDLVEALSNYLNVPVNELIPNKTFKIGWTISGQGRSFEEMFL